MHQKEIIVIAKLAQKHKAQVVEDTFACAN